MASIGQDLADLFAAPAPRVTWLMFQPWGFFLSWRGERTRKNSQGNAKTAMGCILAFGEKSSKKYPSNSEIVPKRPPRISAIQGVGCWPLKSCTSSDNFPRLDDVDTCVEVTHASRLFDKEDSWRFRRLWWEVFGSKRWEQDGTRLHPFAGSKPHASGNQGWCQDPSNLAPLLWWLLTRSPEVKKTMEPFKESDETGEGLSKFFEHPQLTIWTWRDVSRLW